MQQYMCTQKITKEVSRWYQLEIANLRSANPGITLPKEFVEMHFKLNDKYNLYEPQSIAEKNKDLDLLVMSPTALEYDAENKVHVARLKYEHEKDQLMIQIRKDFPTEKTNGGKAQEKSSAQLLLEHYSNLFIVG